MGSLLDEFELDLLIFDESSVSNADDARSTDSNDNALLLGMPDEQTFNGDAPAITTSIVEEEEDATPLRKSDYGEGPCSNDNPDWDEGTVHCPNATFHGIFDGVTETPATASPDDIVSNEFDGTTEATEAPNDNVANNEDIVDGVVGMTSSPSKKPSASPSKKPESNDTTEIVDGVTGTTTSPPSKKPSTAPSKQPSGSTTITPADDTFDTNNVDEMTYPSFYSCTATSEEDLVQGNGDGNGGNEELPFRFNYEIYTSTSVDDITTVLSTFERQLANGVASSLGLVDCPDASSGSGEIDDTAVEFAKRSGGGAYYPWGGGRQLMPLGGTRRTLQKGRSGGKKNRLLESTDIVGVSMDPTDELDTELLNCTSSATLDTPSKCSPIIGAMTVWMTNAQQRHLRQLVDTGSKEEQEAMLLNTVQSYIEQNEGSYLNDELLHVAYIGQRNLTTVGDTNIDGAQETIDLDAGDGGGLKNPLIALAAVGVFLVLVVFGAAWAYRRRQREAEPGLDMETGAFPALTPESASNMYETQDSPPPQDENVRSNNLFGLNGVPSDDTSVQSIRELTPPSSLSIIGGASMLGRQLSYSPPRSSPKEESSDQQDTTQNSQPLDTAQDSQPRDTTLDSQPLLDMAPTMEYASDESSTFEALDEDDDESLVPPMSPEETVVAKNGPGAFDDTALTESYDDDDDPQYSGLMV